MGRGLLFLVSGFVIIFGMIQLSAQNRQQALMKRSPQYFYQEQSSNIAGAAMEIALARLNNNIFNPEAAKADNIELLNGTGSISFYDEPDAFGSRVYLEIKGKILHHNGDKTITTIKAVANRPAFSIYAYFTDVEPTIWFVTGDVLTGPVHTNGTFHIDGDPVFNGMVTSPHTPEMKNGSDPQYNKGKNFDAQTIEMPESVPDLVTKAEDGGLRFDKTIKVTFEDDEVEVRKQIGTEERKRLIPTAPEWAEEYVEEHEDFLDNPVIPEEYADNLTQEELVIAQAMLEEAIITQEVPIFGDDQEYDIDEFNGIISSSGDVFVEGTLDGKITLHSEQDIIITGDLTYENPNFGNEEEGNGPGKGNGQGPPCFGDDHPGKGNGNGNGPCSSISDDLLGIISEGDVIVEEDAHERHGNSDLTIHASIMALESFTVENYNDFEERGQLNIVGGLIQQERGAVGLVAGSGYLKNYSYDERLLTNSTNGFPRIKRFDINSWRETTETTNN